MKEVRVVVGWGDGWEMKDEIIVLQRWVLRAWIFFRYLLLLLGWETVKHLNP